MNRRGGIALGNVGFGRSGAWDIRRRRGDSGSVEMRGELAVDYRHHPGNPLDRLAGARRGACPALTLLRPQTVTPLSTMSPAKSIPAHTLTIFMRCTTSMALSPIPGLGCHTVNAFGKLQCLWK